MIGHHSLIFQVETHTQVCLPNPFWASQMQLILVLMTLLSRSVILLSQFNYKVCSHPLPSRASDPRGPPAPAPESKPSYTVSYQDSSTRGPRHLLAQRIRTWRINCWSWIFCRGSYSDLIVSSNLDFQIKNSAYKHRFHICTRIASNCIVLGQCNTKWPPIDYKPVSHHSLSKCCILLPLSRCRTLWSLGSRDLFRSMQNKCIQVSESIVRGSPCITWKSGTRNKP